MVSLLNLVAELIVDGGLEILGLLVVNLPLRVEDYAGGYGADGGSRGVGSAVTLGIGVPALEGVAFAGEVGAGVAFIVAAVAEDGVAVAGSGSVFMCILTAIFVIGIVDDVNFYVLYVAVDVIGLVAVVTAVRILFRNIGPAIAEGMVIYLVGDNSIFAVFVLHLAEVLGQDEPVHVKAFVNDKTAFFVLVLIEIGFAVLSQVADIAGGVVDFVFIVAIKRILSAFEAETVVRSIAQPRCFEALYCA